MIHPLVFLCVWLWYIHDSVVISLHSLDVCYCIYQCLCITVTVFVTDQLYVVRLVCVYARLVIAASIWHHKCISFASNLSYLMHDSTRDIMCAWFEESSKVHDANSYCICMMHEWSCVYDSVSHLACMIPRHPPTDRPTAIHVYLRHAAFRQCSGWRGMLIAGNAFLVCFLYEVVYWSRWIMPDASSGCCLFILLG